MKHEVTTLNTKRALAAALKKLMEQKPLSKITVSEIIASCGVNRKTFYYHFTDIYDLLKWMLEQEAIEVVKQFDLLVDCREAVLFIMDYVGKNKHLLRCAYDSVGRDELRQFFHRDFQGISENLIEDIAQRLGLRVNEEFKKFLAHFYVEAVAGLLIGEFTGKENHDPEKVVEYVTLVVQNSLPQILTAAAQPPAL